MLTGHCTAWGMTFEETNTVTANKVSPGTPQNPPILAPDVPLNVPCSKNATLIRLAPSLECSSCIIGQIIPSEIMPPASGAPWIIHPPYVCLQERLAIEAGTECCDTPDASPIQHKATSKFAWLMNR